MPQVALTRLLVWAALLSTIIPTADTARAKTTDELELVIAGLDVAVWPPEGGTGPYPLVLFSHGLGGCKTQSTYLMRGLAEHGMLVVAPDHKDKGEYCPTRVPTPAEIEKGLLGPHEYRMEDLQKLRDALPTETKLSGWRIDPDRVALVGHSLGGFTVLALAASWPNSKKDEIAAVVALAPYARPLLTDGAVDSIPVPVLLQRGGGEFSLLAVDQGNLFPKLPAPACEVVYPKADHFAWTDVQPDFHDATAAATIAFLDEAFAGRPPTEAMLASSQTDPPDCKP